MIFQKCRCAWSLAQIDTSDTDRAFGAELIPTEYSMGAWQTLICSLSLKSNNRELNIWFMN